MLLILAIKYLIITVKWIEAQSVKGGELVSTFTHFSSTNQERSEDPFEDVFTLKMQIVTYQKKIQREHNNYRPISVFAIS